ncbi:hypothetical protein [Adhaeribacter pallidiroseus]|uniref:Uncharacterized protein n=1 Tax=Adhaeribacter pallidiroseus TaxID=2072847 RepID=A0A369QJ19_9BACT|nr:hypothetical protein [Adhaeribacter pallidiroseus]RDC64714.1 hypothetical protein AHMF7616_03330 [Adhaeribacter pallidiroseus]
MALIFSFWCCSSKQDNQTRLPLKVEDSVSAEPAPRTATNPIGVTPNRLIVPGKSIGLTALQEKAEVVTARLGKPDSSDAAMGKALATWFSKPDTTVPKAARHQTTIYFKTNMGGPDEASRVDQIRITSPYFLTIDSVHVNSDVASIQKSFPEIVKVAAYTSPQNAAKVTIYDDAAAGIAFEMNEQARCVAITVHAANQGIKNSYLPLFPDMEKF